REDLCGAALQNRLVSLAYHGAGVIGVRMQRSEERRGPRQIAFSLCDTRLCGECVQVIRCDIENLIKLPQRFGETTKCHVGKRVLRSEERRVGREARARWAPGDRR